MKRSKWSQAVVDGAFALLGLVLLSGSASARQQILYQVGGDQVGDQLGRTVSKAGDVDGDGYADFMAGGPPSDRNGTSGVNSHRGYVVVFSGRDGTGLYSYVGEHDGAGLGDDVSDGGDVNADGYDDFVMGAWGTDVVVGGLGGGLKEHAGTADVRSGFDGTRLYLFSGANKSEGIGYSVSGAGDVDADGFMDLAIGSLEGTLWIRSGRDGSLIRKHSNDPQVGQEVSGAGDVNADGFDDVMGGESTYQSSRGIVRVFSGQDGQELYRWVGAAGYDSLGFSVADAGDVDRDGFGDVIAGEPGYPGPYGKARVYSGATGATLYVFGGAFPGNVDLGFSVAGAGDIDNDGHDDLICGGPSVEFVPGGGEGRVWVFSGRDGGLLFTLDAMGLVTYLGESVDGAGDVDGDGYADVIAGAGPTSYLVAQGGYAVVASGPECGSLRSYPAECAGQGGFAPALTMLGCLVAGNPLELSLTNGPGGAPAALIISMTSATSPLGSGCLLHVGFPATIIPLGALSGSGPGAGTWSTSATVPPLPGTTLFLAALVQDGTQRLATNTLEVSIAP